MRAICHPQQGGCWVWVSCSKPAHAFWRLCLQLCAATHAKHWMQRSVGIFVRWQLDQVAVSMSLSHRCVSPSANPTACERPTAPHPNPPKLSPPRLPADPRPQWRQSGRHCAVAGLCSGFPLPRHFATLGVLDGRGCAGAAAAKARCGG